MGVEGVEDPQTENVFSKQSSFLIKNRRATGAQIDLKLMCRGVVRTFQPPQQARSLRPEHGPFTRAAAPGHSQGKKPSRAERRPSAHLPLPFPSSP